MPTHKYQVVYPLAPGSTPSVEWYTVTLAQARALARKVVARRRRLQRGQGVRIETLDGQLVECAGGPA